MKTPHTFLGIPLLPDPLHAPEPRTARWVGGAGTISVSVHRELNATWVGGEVTPVYYIVHLRIASCLSPEEIQGEDLDEVEAHFVQWIADFKEAARAVFKQWPDFNDQTRTGRLRSDVPNMSNSPKPDKPHD